MSAWRSPAGRLVCGGIGLGVLALSAAPARGQDEPAAPRRTPAEFMSYHGADWLERAERVDEEQPERVLDTLGLAPGDVVADVGCGSGYYARRLARRVQPGGTVYCQDIQPEMLDIMQRRAADAGVDGIEAVLGAPDDPRLPPGALDWVLIADVYHEMSAPEAMLAGIRRALAPGGRVALLEYRVEDGSGDWIKADHAMSVRQVLDEWQAAGFALDALHDFLPSQHLFVFRADAAAEADAAPGGAARRAEGAGRGATAAADGDPAARAAVAASAGDRPAGAAEAAILVDYDLFAAMDAGLIEVEARGAGRDAVRLRIRRTARRPILVTSPAATLFAANGARDMLARRDGWILLPDDAWRDWTVRAVGRGRDREPPGAGDRLAIRPPSTVPALAAVLQAAQIGTYTVGDSPTLYPPRTWVVEQAAVWIADGDAGYAALEPHIAGPRVPAPYAAAFALVFLDRAGLDVTARRIWRDRADIFDRLRDPGLSAWYRSRTRGR